MGISELLIQMKRADAPRIEAEKNKLLSSPKPKKEMSERDKRRAFIKQKTGGFRK